MTIKYEVGQKYHRLTIERIFKQENVHGRMAACLCDCGIQKNIRLGSLGNGHSKSCGCSRREINKTHGMTHTRVYSIWEGMIQRCTNKKSTGYDNYGGRGITVCEEWRDFNNFYADMGLPPDRKTLDRKNNDIGYCKDNCRWATWKEQHSNKRMRKDNQTGVTGLEYWGNRFRCRVKGKHLGIFDTIGDAISAIELARKDHKND